MRFADRVVVVTGGGSGIGNAAAKLFLEEGARVAVLDCAPNVSDAHLAITCDVTAEGAVQAAFADVASRFGRVDILLNSAGIAVRKPVMDETVEAWDRCQSVNVRGTFLCSKHAVHHMPGGGAIIHISSVTGLTGMRNRAAYSASKGAIIALTKSMAMDLASRQIRVNCICPGFVKTPLLSTILKDTERTAKLTRMHPLGRLGTPEDVAKAVLFLASDDAAWITGHALAVDGGFSAGYSEDV